MKILGLTIHWFHFRSRHRRKVANKLDRVVNTVLLDAAVKNPEVLAQIVNKYGEIQVRYDDKIATEADKIRAKVYEEAVQTILNSRREELVSRIGAIIDRVMGLSNMQDRHQHEEISFGDITPSGQNSRLNIAHQHRDIERSLKSGPNSSVFMRGLAMLTVLREMTIQQRKKQNRGSLEE